MWPRRTGVSPRERGPDVVGRTAAEGAIYVTTLALAAIVVHWGLPAVLHRWSERHPGVPLAELVVLLVVSHLLLAGVAVWRTRQLEIVLRRNRHDALHDGLTGLPNRTLFFDRLEQATASGRRRRTPAAVLLMDLDGFKEINDTLGHAAGDMLLAQVAERLRTSLREPDTVARLGGDEFALVVGDLDDEAAVDVVAARLLAAVTEPVRVGGHECTVNASVGVAVQGRDGDGCDELLRRADAAMYAAKRAGGGIAHYDHDRDDAAARLAAITELRTAIEEGQLRLHFQPSVRLDDRVVTGVEALVRWQHPVRGLLAPDRFIPLAEASELIGPLTVWVLGEAVRQCRAWFDAGHDLCVAVNLSARNVVDERLPGLVREVLERHDLPADRVVFEITETSLINRPDDARRILDELTGVGVNIAVDDFGTGYATLAWLQQLPFNALKIDRSFVADVTTGGPGAELVRYTTQLAHAMGKVVVAEGVESAEEWEALHRMGCDHGQGFGIGRPQPADALVRWLADWHAASPPAAGAA